jgi:hypothetical protein
MATVTPTRPVMQNRAESDRRVRHPLQALRGYIRMYVTLEGAAIAVIYLALAFWIGLALDYGCFKLFNGFDWIEELQGLSSETGPAEMVIRWSLLGIFVAGLLAVVALKVLLRLFREFRDSALALVLERRYPKELGDRLITAVEMADPKLARTYGYSQVLVEKTIHDAAERVERVPVRSVFNWGRLWRLGACCAILTVGLYLVVAAGYLGISAIAGTSAGPGDFVIRFHHTASIWTERNILLMNTYWPRQAHLELVRFQQSPRHPGEMRVGRDEQRPDLHVRSFQWLIADDKARGGWRPARWQDLDQLVGQDMVARVNIPSEWQGWRIDLDDLDEKVPGNVLPSGWQGMTSGFIRGELQKPELRESIRRAGAAIAVEAMLDWHTWTVDKIMVQERIGDVRRALRQELPEAHKALEAVLERLDELGRSATMERQFRKLDVPDDVEFFYWGKTTKITEGPDANRSKDSDYYFPLGGLKESVRFTVRAADFTTPVYAIELVPPPGLKKLTVDKQEPAYIYYRLQGDQEPLKGKKQKFWNVPISITGESSIVQVPFGTDLVLTAEADRELKDTIRMRRPTASEERGAVNPEGSVALEADRKTFSVAFGNVKKSIEFDFEFYDLDNVKGKRRIIIRPNDDRTPEVFDVEMTKVLRKPRFKAEPGKAVQGTPADGFLITPDALVPFKGTLRDDYGLTAANWLYELEPVDIELVGRTEKDRLPSLIVGGDTQMRRAQLIVSGLRFMPGFSGPDDLGRAYWAFVSRIVAADLAMGSKFGRQEGKVPLEQFKTRLDDNAGLELPLNGFLQKLAERESRRGQEKEKEQDAGRAYVKVHSLKDEAGFDFKRYLSNLKVKDPSKEAQLHYLVRLSVAATDNNVDTGPAPVAATVAAGGSGYKVDDTITLAGGTFTAPALLKVTAVDDDGAVTAVTVKSEGNYIVVPPSPADQASTSGGGSKARFNLTLGATGSTKAPFTFLVVSENELLAQIFIEEETIRDRLEKVLLKLKNARISISEQIGKLSGEGDLSLVAIRVDEIRKALSDTGSATREVYADYRRILDELEVNRVGWDRGKEKINNVRDKIVDPLEEVVNPTIGNYPQSEDAVAKLYQALDEDLNALREAGAKVPESLLEKLKGNRPGHVASATVVSDRLDQLIIRINAILAAMEEGIEFSQILEAAVNLEREQRQAAERLDRFRKEWIRIILGEAGAK